MAATEKSPADLLKDEGNALFTKSHFKDAIAKYTEAIDLDGKNEIYWCNRAFANLKSENFGAAISDATQSIQLNPRHVKAYFHRGAAHLVLAHLEEALKDFHTVRKEGFSTFSILITSSK
jgi:serine/threonine-protein phosphatase 5